MKRLLKHTLPIMTLAVAIKGIPSAFASSTDFFKTGAEGINVVAKGELGTNIVDIINYALGILGIVAVAFIIYGGILMVTSGGNEEGVGKAKKILTYAAIGFVLIAISYSIVTFVTSIFG